MLARKKVRRWKHFTKMSDCKSNAKFATRNCRRLEETRRGCAITCARWGVSTRSGGRAAAATACRAANTPPSTYRTNAANGMRRYTRMHPATSRHAALMKSDIRILTGLSHSISGFGKNSILTSLIGCNFFIIIIVIII